MKRVGIQGELRQPLDAFALDERVLLMTNEHRSLVMSARELADLHASGLDLATVAGFHSDAFGKEVVCALAAWSALDNAADVVALNTRGYAKRLVGEGYVRRLDQPIPYQMERSRGYPAALLRVAPEGEVVAISHAGRAVRMAVSRLSTQEARLIQLPGESAIIGAFYLEQPCEILVATASGYGQRILSSAIPQTEAFNTTGEKIVTRTQPVIARLHRPDRALWAVTNRRIVPVDQRAIPLLDPGATTAHPLLRLKKGERLVSLIYTDCG